MWKKVECARRRFKSETEKKKKLQVVDEIKDKGKIWQWRYIKKADKDSQQQDKALKTIILSKEDMLERVNKLQTSPKTNFYYSSRPSNIRRQRDNLSQSKFKDLTEAFQSRNYSFSKTVYENVEDKSVVFGAYMCCDMFDDYKGDKKRIDRIINSLKYVKKERFLECIKRLNKAKVIEMWDLFRTHIHENGPVPYQIYIFGYLLLRMLDQCVKEFEYSNE